jgi:hypothetical protein
MLHKEDRSAPFLALEVGKPVLVQEFSNLALIRRSIRRIALRRLHAKFASDGQGLADRYPIIELRPVAPEFECLPDSEVPRWLAAGIDVTHPDGTRTSFPKFELREEPDSERIIVDQIVQRFTQNGFLVTEGSTEAAVRTIMHAGVCKTRRFSFDIP